MKRVVPVERRTSGPLHRDATGSIAIVALQHAEDAAALRQQRSVLVRAPHARLLHLLRHDERIAAHLDGLLVAGELGSELCDRALSPPSRGFVFVAVATAAERGDHSRVIKALALAEFESTAWSGALSALAWVSPLHLRDLTQGLLGSRSAFRRTAGLATCVLHGVVPGDAVLAAALHDTDERLRARALNAAGRLGHASSSSSCANALVDDDETCRLEAACAALLLGERRKSIDELTTQATAGRRHRAAALSRLLLAAPSPLARRVLKSLSTSEKDIRLLVRGTGLAGDPHFLPWLLAQMDRPALARLAGEAFSLITGLDLADLDLERLDPPPHDAGPNDDPDDDKVAMDEDDGLPWPDVDKLRSWWRQNQSNFPAGTRFFMGQPLNAAHCVEVLKTGRQHQRIVAAHHRSLLAPGTPLFNCAAPAWRQRRALGLG